MAKQRIIILIIILAVVVLGWVAVQRVLGASKTITVESVLDASGGLIIDTGATNPASPAVGQIWMCTDNDGTPNNCTPD